mmetsp:Transcript_95173/g.269387  ORF Transcript_95173/g.269387 Transcript_95173/m.269387 type:complete len:193 (-) Transcript_95173:81-659(-)
MVNCVRGLGYLLLMPISLLCGYLAVCTLLLLLLWFEEWWAKLPDEERRGICLAGVGAWAIASFAVFHMDCPGRLALVPCGGVVAIGFALRLWLGVAAWAAVSLAAGLMARPGPLMLVPYGGAAVIGVVLQVWLGQRLADSFDPDRLGTYLTGLGTWAVASIAICLMDDAGRLSIVPALYVTTCSTVILGGVR